MNAAVIVGYARSPFTPAGKGALARVRPDDLLAQVVRALMERTQARPEDIEDIIVGCAFPEGEQGLNIARMVGFMAGLPYRRGRRDGQPLVRLLDDRGAHRRRRHRDGRRIAVRLRRRGEHDPGADPGLQPAAEPAPRQGAAGVLTSMGITAENLAQRYQIGRDAQEQFAVVSHRRAAAAQEEGRFAEEIVPIVTKHGTVDRDGCIRAETSAETLSGLQPSFLATGTVTAGTSSPLTDGAAAVLVADADYAERHGCRCWRASGPWRLPAASRRSWASARCRRRARPWHAPAWRSRTST